MQILTFKIRHNNPNLRPILDEAKHVAQFGIDNHGVLKNNTSKYFPTSDKNAVAVAALWAELNEKRKEKGLHEIAPARPVWSIPAIISNAVMKKYLKNKKAKNVRNVKLTINGQNNFKYDAEKKEVYVPCIKTHLNLQYLPQFDKVNQIECGPEFAYVSVSIVAAPKFEPKTVLGVDRNARGHFMVAGLVEIGPELKLGTVFKAGREATHQRTKYKKLRGKMQASKNFKMLKKVSGREHRKLRDLAHKISKHLIDLAVKHQSVIVLEKLDGIRTRANKKNKYDKKTRGMVNSWAFYQFQTFLEYKANLAGVQVVYVDPAYTSQDCSKCGTRNEVKGKKYECSHCGHQDHRDVNAAFNIALRYLSGHAAYVSSMTAPTVCAEGDFFTNAENESQMYNNIATTAEEELRSIFCQKAAVAVAKTVVVQ